MQQTSKKVKVIRRQSELKAETNESIDVQVSNIEERDFNFHKVWIHAFFDMIEPIGNTKIKLMFWILVHLNRENQLTMTYRQISASSGISLSTVRDTLKHLLEADFLRRVNSGCYMVNPDVLFKGGREARINLLKIYSSCKKYP